MKNQKGITLIALVITIIVLLILAGVAIAMLSGENGILSQAENAKKETIAAEAVERINLALNAIKAESYNQLAKNGAWVAVKPAVTANPDAEPPVAAADAAIDADVAASLAADGFTTAGTDGWKYEFTEKVITLTYTDEEFDDIIVTGKFFVTDDGETVKANTMEAAQIPAGL